MSFLWDASKAREHSKASLDKEFTRIEDTVTEELGKLQSYIQSAAEEGKFETTYTVKLDNSESITTLRKVVTRMAEILKESGYAVEIMPELTAASPLVANKWDTKRRINLNDSLNTDKKADIKVVWGMKR